MRKELLDDFSVFADVLQVMGSLQLIVPVIAVLPPIFALKRLGMVSLEEAAR
jgi:hypothetical protein